MKRAIKMAPAKRPSDFDLSIITVREFVPRKFTAEELCDHDIVQPNVDFRYCLKCDWNQGS